MHRIPEPNALQVVSPGLCIVREPLVEGPAADIFNGDRVEACKRAQAVVSHEGFCGDGRASPDEFVVLGVVIGAVKASPVGDVDEVGGGAADVRMPG